MRLAPATHLGAYEILSLIGAGGMGEVYRARDTRLGRDVAIKVLPDVFAGDAERLARFQREAQVLASLNHPHIAAIYDLQEHDRTPFLVLELVEGDTLAEKLAEVSLNSRGPGLPLAETLRIAIQIADALEAAHEKGIVHRDLKPANVKVTAEGTVKVLDFGLAKMFEGETLAPGLSHSPTMSAMATGGGVILGTAAYMSPEQARGKPADKRTDIWAFGCVLHEMLTGRQTFGGETVSDSIAAILGREPDFQAVPAATPEAIRGLLQRCLQKDVHRRLRDIGEARIAIDETLSAASRAVPAAAAAPRKNREHLAWTFVVIAALAVVALSIPAFLHLREVPVDPPEVRLDAVTPATPDPISFALSPDGRRLAFVASGDGPARLWLRPLDAVTALPLAGTEGAYYPFWSPDSRSIGFFAGGKLMRIDINGGPPQPLANVATGRGGTWNNEGIIVFAPGAGPLYRISSSGGEAATLTRLDPPRHNSHRFPHFLPDGRQVLFFAQGSEAQEGIYLGSLDGDVTRRVVAADTAGAYLAPGLLLFLRQGALVARPFDAGRGALLGDPVTIADPVGFDGGANVGAFSVSAAGPIAYRTGGAGQRQLTWFDRVGKPLGVVGQPDDGDLRYVELSPDGRRVAITRTVQSNTDVWLIDMARGNPTRFTFDASSDGLAIWSPDGSQIVFRSNRKGAYDLYRKPSSGAGSEELLVESPQLKVSLDWSPDGRFLLYQEANPKTSTDLLVRPMTGDGRATPFLNTPFEERNGEFSPDGRWVAYQSNETGRHEVYVRPFPGPGGQWQVSTSGGIAPRWRADTKELFYIAPDAKLMAAPVRAVGTAFETSAPVALFQTRIFGGGTQLQRAQYAVAVNGRFLINVTTEEAAVSPITVILNWKTVTSDE